MPDQVSESRYPKSFVPCPPKVTAITLPFWLLSQTGRARIKLWRAYCDPKDQHRRNSVIMALNELLSQEVPSNQARSIIVREILLFLVWSAILNGDFDEASHWLEELDNKYPELSERMDLRWDLMYRMREKQLFSVYTQQAKAFLADPLVNYDEFAEAVLETIAFCYEKVSRNACLDILSTANETIKQTSQYQAAFEMCRCPDSFQTKEEAQKWCKAICPDYLEFSLVMKADAILVAAREAEWFNNQKDMERYASEALKLAPGYQSACYWLARAKLYSQQSDPSDVVDLKNVPDSPEWFRLVCQITLHKEPTFEHAEAVLPMLEGQYGHMDSMEKALTIALLERALTSDSSWPQERISECARLCHLTEKAARQQFPWTQVSIALWEILVEHKYVAAFKRLEKEDVLKTPVALRLARVARILGGMPKRVHCKTSDPLATIERAMYHVFADDDADAFTLIERLAQARKDSLCVEFPLLGAAVDVLRSTLVVLFGGKGEEMTKCNLPNHASPWMFWLCTRAALMQECGFSPDTHLAYLANTHPACAWVVERWWTLYGLAGVKIPDVVAACKDKLNKARLDINIKEKWELGELCEKLLIDELEIERAYINGRRQLGGSLGLAQDAARTFGALLKRINRMPPVSSCWWLPVITYWYGVSLARVDPQSAQTALQSLESGPKALEAKAQLALLAIRRNDLDTAEDYLTDLPVVFPAALYTQALLQARRGNIDKAYEMLSSYDVRFGSVDSPYSAASKRLMAGLMERQGNINEAERLYRDTLATYPGDIAASACLGRILLRKLYVQAIEDIQNRNDEVEALIKVASVNPLNCIKWSHTHGILYSLLVCPEEQLSARYSEILSTYKTPEQALPFLQVITRRLLGARRADEAREVLEILKDEGSFAKNCSWYWRTRQILGAWHLLRRVWSPYKLPEQSVIDAEVRNIQAKHMDNKTAFDIWSAVESKLRREALAVCISQEVFQEIPDYIKQIDSSLSDDSDEIMWRWRFLLQQALVLSDSLEPVFEADLWQKLEPWPGAYLPGLWASNPEEQTRAAQMLASFIESEQLAWNREQRVLLQALIAKATGDEDVYLENYQLLEPVIEDLPVEASSLWLEAASIWFRQKDWKQLLEGKLPECIVDLSNPQVRLLIGLAYAQAAADDGLKDARRAMQRVRQARSTLEQLIDINLKE